MNLWQTLGKRTVLFDGGMGTLLQSKGLQAGESPMLWTLSHPDVLLEIHSQYLEVGCDVVTTNTFGANRLMLPRSIPVSDVVGKAVALAKKATYKAGRGAVALDIGPSGRLLAPYGDLPFEEAVSIFGEVVRAGTEAGADFILLETMTDSYEIKAAVLAAKEYSSLPIMVTMMFGNQGKLLTGADVRGMVALLESLGVSALGCNCGFGPAQLKGIAAQLLAEASVPVIVNPNAGLPEIVDGQTCYLLGPEVFAAETAEIAEMGAWMVGGCCGTTPAHIAALRKACESIRPKPIEKKDTCVVSSWGRSVSLDGQVLVIGERINPTGKKRLRQALRSRDIDYVLDEALAQQEQGAQVLDFNVGVPDLDEATLFTDFLPEVQAVTDLPIQIDTSNVCAMEKALRIYNGKPLINSVCGKPESMEAIFPLIKRYGGALVALTLDEAGIPQDVEGRLAIAEKICSKAMEYGIERRNILVDALTFPIATQENAAAVTLETVRQLRERMGLRTVLGVSNVSFGLPRRSELNAAFLTMAIQAGLSAAIINPGAPEMMQALRTASALAGRDARFARYLAYEGSNAAAQARGDVTTSTCTLEEAILGGLNQAAVEATAMLLQSKSAEEIIQQYLMPALDQVAKRYDAGSIYLPQLLQSTDAAKAAFDALKPNRSDTAQAPRILLATVYGDVHDIGKNIVKVLLENYGFSVVDLGKNVPHAMIVDTVLERGIKLVGLSALMTTTVPSMQEAINLLREKAPGVRIMVGGAVLTEALAHRIGADAYGQDAMAAVSIARKYLGEAR